MKGGMRINKVAEIVSKPNWNSSDWKTDDMRVIGQICKISCGREICEGGEKCLYPSG